MKRVLKVADEVCSWLGMIWLGLLLLRFVCLVVSDVWALVKAERRGASGETVPAIAAPLGGETNKGKAKIYMPVDGRFEKGLN